jgi:RimJ/RimL family protein N-acetyltransferase
MGRVLLARSIDLYFKRFRLETVECEPYAENPAPNRVLTRLGFRWVRRYRTVPSNIAFEQDVNHYELDRGEWEARRKFTGAGRDSRPTLP